MNQHTPVSQSVSHDRCSQSKASLITQPSQAAIISQVKSRSSCRAASAPQHPSTQTTPMQSIGFGLQRRITTSTVCCTLCWALLLILLLVAADARGDFVRVGGAHWTRSGVEVDSGALDRPRKLFRRYVAVGYDDPQRWSPSPLVDATWCCCIARVLQIQSVMAAGTVCTVVRVQALTPRRCRTAGLDQCLWAATIAVSQ